MVVVDSKKEMLQGPKIIAMFVQQQHEAQTSGVPLHASLGTIAAEMGREGVDVAQIGNTVFLGHIKEDKMLGRAFNVDTARNFVQNVLKYHAHLRRRGVSWYVTEYSGDSYTPIFRRIERAIADTDTKMQWARRKANGNTVLIFKLGDKPVIGEQP